LGEAPLHRAREASKDGQLTLRLQRQRHITNKPFCS